MAQYCRKSSSNSWTHGRKWPRCGACKEMKSHLSHQTDPMPVFERIDQWTTPCRVKASESHKTVLSGKGSGGMSGRHDPWPRKSMSYDFVKLAKLWAKADKLVRRPMCFFMQLPAVPGFLGLCAGGGARLQPLQATPPVCSVERICVTWPILGLKGFLRLPAVVFDQIMPLQCFGCFLFRGLLGYKNLKEQCSNRMEKHCCGDRAQAKEGTFD